MLEMSNAKEELLQSIGDVKIKCARIVFGDEGHSWRDEERSIHELKVGYNDKDLAEFLSGIDKKYDDGFGGQELFGTVWLQDNTWMDRGEYDGSEWWALQTMPTIPEQLV